MADTRGRAPRVVIVGLGPGDADLLTAGTLRRLAGPVPVFLRTTRHPSASVVPDATSCDDLYDQLATFDEVYAAIVERLVAAASASGEVLYAVPGSPLVAEHTVELLLRDPRVAVEIVPALSFLDLSWVRLEIDPLADGVTIVDGHRFRVDTAGSAGPFLVAQCHSNDVLSDVKLALEEPSDARRPDVRILHHLGLPDEAVLTVPWDELDRSVVADHLTSIYIPRLGAPFAAEMVRIEELMRTLRSGCPWDAEQTHASLARYVEEEAAELVEAISALTNPQNAGAPDPVDHFEEELGDVLFQVVFHACLAAEEGWFTLADVVRTLREKLVRRHPHVFPRAGFDTTAGEHAVRTSEDVVRNWERIKQAERAARNGPPVKVRPARPGSPAC